MDGEVWMDAPDDVNYDDELSECKIVRFVEVPCEDDGLDW